LAKITYLAELHFTASRVVKTTLSAHHSTLPCPSPVCPDTSLFRHSPGLFSALAIVLASPQLGTSEKEERKIQVADQSITPLLTQ